MIEQLESSKIVEFALKYVGAGFLFGGTNPKTGFDNPGFTQFVFANTLGMALPHSANTQANFGIEISRQNLKPGDLVFFAINGGKSINHVGIFLGDSQFIHAFSGSQMGVYASDLCCDNFWARHYITARRIR